MSSNSDFDTDSDYLESSKLYFQIAHDEYLRELDRSKGFEDKIGRLLTVLNFLIVIILAFFSSSSFLSFIDDLSSGLRILVLSLSLLILCFVFISWWLLLEASHFTDTKRISIDDNLRNWLNFKRSPDMYLAAGDQCRASIEETSKNIEACKVVPLHKSLFFLKLSVLTLLSYFILILILKFGEITVTNNTDKPSQPPPQQEPIRKIPEYKPEPLRGVQESNVKPFDNGTLLERQGQK